MKPKHYMPHIRTQRLIIKPFLYTDVTDAYKTWINDAETTRYLRIKKNSQDDQAINHYLTQQLKNTTTQKHFAILDRKTMTVIGSFTCPAINWEASEAEISFVIGHPDFQGQGLATEVVQAMAAVLFDYFKIKTLIAGYFEGHEASRKILEKNGFTFHQKLPQNFEMDDGKIVDNNITHATQISFKAALKRRSAPDLLLEII